MYSSYAYLSGILTWGLILQIIFDFVHISDATFPFVTCRKKFAILQKYTAVLVNVVSYSVRLIEVIIESYEGTRMYSSYAYLSNIQTWGLMIRKLKAL